MEFIKGITSKKKCRLNPNIYEYDKRGNIESYIAPLTDNNYEKKDLWSIPQLIKKFIVLKNNIKAYKNTDYEYKKEEINQNLKSRFDMEIEGLTFYNFVNMIKEGYQSDVELSYKIFVENNTITRYIKQEKDFEKQVLTYLADSSIVTEDTLLILETLCDQDVSYVKDLGFRITRRKEYKNNMHVFLERAEA